MEGVTADTTPEAKKKRTKLVRVKPWYMESILTAPRVRFLDPSIADCITDPELRETHRRTQAEIVALYTKIYAEEDDIIEQYLTKGYAYQEIELDDDDEDA
ncbi:hypothetical protein ACP4OV_002059 [Aristida adscensionis]